LTSGGFRPGMAFTFAFKEFANCTQLTPDVKWMNYLSRDALGRYAPAQPAPDRAASI
jgi:hypothetical protein